MLAHADWVRALARHLTADAHAADDLAQDALAAALVRPPGDERPLRGWLAAVLRNLVRQSRRETGNRIAREQTAARAEAGDSSSELLERLESHRAVVEAVARLDEPYRGAILLRYFEGLAPAAIAARTGTPLRTVHTRLQRALARLRADLDRAHGGDRRAWLLALIPYARGSGGGTLAALGAFVMETKLKLGVAALALLGVFTTFALWKSDASEASARPESAAETPALVAPEPHADAGERAEVAPAREARAPEAPPALATSTPPSAPVPRLTGRVLDVERAPVAGIRVRYRASQGEARAGWEAESDASGAFALERPDVGGALEVASPGWTSLFRPTFAGAPPARELVLVVARSVTLAGRVLDEEGRGIESARVGVPLPFRMRARFDAILDGASTVERETHTDADGRFELGEAPLIDDVELVSEHSAFLADRRALPGYDELALEIVLHRAQAEPERLVGRVVDPDGEPVAGAWVGLGDACERSGTQGEFALDIAPAAAREGTSDTLRALKSGYLPAELTRARGEPWPAPLVLELGPPPLTIRGRVVDARGEPVSGAEVWTDEETHFGYVPLGDGETSVRAGATVEGLLRDDPWVRRVRANAAGRFELRGLQERDYRLHALDLAHLALATTRAPAGTLDVELRLPDEERHARIGGRVTNLAGEPLAGIRVVLERLALSPGPADQLESLATETDAEGRFRFQDVSRSVHAVRATGAELGLGGFVRRLAADDDLEHLELAVPLRVHVRIEAAPDADFDHVALLDAQGEKLTLSVDHGEHSYAMQDMDLDHGRSEAFSVSELATTLVLYAKGAELRRVPVTLARDGLNTLRP